MPRTPTDAPPGATVVGASMRTLLRGLPVLRAEAEPFDAAGAPADPTELFSEWLRTAVDAGVPEPHAMTVSTVAIDGTPDARTLILKDLDAQGWWFASASTGAKGLQLERRPEAALTFYWPQLGRQIRVSGSVVAAPADRCTADFADRGTGAQAVAMTGQQSRPLADPAELATAVAHIRSRLDAGAPAELAGWTLWAVDPRRVEFWQSDPDRLHTRLLSTRTPRREWTRGLLWP